MKYKRVLLKLSGESLAGADKNGINPQCLQDYVEQIKQAKELGVEIAIVIGGGNIFRGVSGISKGVDRIQGDKMGMLATIINGLALTSSLNAIGVETEMLTAIRMEPIGNFYSAEKADKLLSNGIITILAGGTGHPYFTTDTTAVLRAIEIKADAMFKGTRVDGVYSADPEKDSSATKFDTISYNKIYEMGLRIMDLTATTMCQENSLQTVVFDMDTKGNLLKVLQGENLGTVLTS